MVNAVIWVSRSSREVKSPRRSSRRVSTPNHCSSGNPGALPRRGPLRTGRARFPGSSAQASPGGSLPGRSAGLVPLPMRRAAVGVYEMVRGAFVRRAEVRHAGDRVLADRLARGGVPLLPFTRALRLVVGVQQQSPAERAPAALAAQQVPGGRVHREPGAASPLVPVPGEGGVVGGRPPGDHPVPDDFRPGELAEVEAGFPAAEHPLVLPGRVEHAEVPGDDPASRLVRVGEPGPFPGQPPQVGIQRAEGALGHPDPVVGGPPGDDRVEPGDHRVGVGPSQGRDLLGQPPPDPPQRILARLGQQLAPVAADLEPQEVHPLIEVGDAGLGLVEGQPPGLQPPGEPLLDVLGLLTGVTQGEHIVGVPHQDRGAGGGAQGARLPST